MKSYNQAKKILINAKLKIKDEIININSSLNRIVSENILSKVNFPAGDNAAFDGFVVKLSLIHISEPTRLGMI